MIRNTGRPEAADFGYAGPGGIQEVEKERARPGMFVTRTYRLRPLSELEDDAYGPGGPAAGPKPKFKEELVAERYFEGIG